MTHPRSLPLAAATWLALCATVPAAAPQAVSSPAGAPPRDRVQGAPVRPAYVLDARLRPDEKALSVHEVVRFANPSAFPLSELRLHVYMNAFRDFESTFMREAKPEYRANWRERDFSRVQLQRIAWGDGADAPAATYEFIAPDDGNLQDATVLRVALPQPLAPGAQVVLAIDFDLRLPKALRRTGWIPGNGFFCMHWYPILGVVEDRDGQATWNCHQFHHNTEFYADFADYDVTLRLPDVGYVVGATGGVPVETSIADGLEVLRFRQQNVHNFAWVADPDFVVAERKLGPYPAAEDPVAVAVAQHNGVPVSDYDLPEVTVRLLLQPEHDNQTQRDRHFRAVETGLKFFGHRYGPYPYPMLTAVDPGRDTAGRSLGGGMEYPMLITCGTRLFPHRRQLRPESVTVHEFGHQYWYGLSANNEFEESWLDEGLNTYSEGRAQDLAFGDEHPLVTTSFGALTLASHPGFVPQRGAIDQWLRLPSSAWSGLPVVGEFLDRQRFSGRVVPESPLLQLLAATPTLTGYREVRHSDCWNDRKRFLDAHTPDAMVQPGWKFLDRGSYSTNSYTRPATVLRTLERSVGRDRWWAFLREFHQQARFSHPTTGDFVNLLGKRFGAETAAYFDSVAAAGAVLDYGIGEVVATGPNKSVVIRRRGSLTLDLPVRCEFADGHVQMLKVRKSDLYPYRRFALDHPADLVRVSIDPRLPGNAIEDPGGPAGVQLLDANLLDNDWQVDSAAKPALYRGMRLMLQVQSQLSFAGWIG